jgi:hypothetical protein
MFSQLNTSMDPLSFSHGQTQSKLWLCENIEPMLPNSAIVAILGCWYNMLGFMLVTRNQHYYQHVLGLDIASEAITGANTLCEGYMFGYDTTKINNKCADANTYNLQGYNVVINCSTEHMTSEWFDNIDPNALVCLQTSDHDNQEEPWLISNPTKSLDEFVAKYPMREILYSGSKFFQYPDVSYNRHMIIGRK